MENIKQQLHKIYGFEFPDSFFEFYDFTKKVLENTSKGFDDVMNISLGDVFDIFDNKTTNPLKKSRYYNDPPEFFTILFGYTDGYHWGYYVDNPNDLRIIPVVSYYHNDAFELSVIGNTIFEAFRHELELNFASNLDNISDDPDYADDYKSEIGQLNKLREILIQYETKERKEQGWEYVKKYNVKRNIAAITRDSIGIIVPKELYKPLKELEKFEIWNYNPSKEEVDVIYKKAIEALEEGYPGTALKAGKDLWVYQKYFDITYKLLDAAYQKLDRILLQNTLKIAKEFRDECDKNRK